jgi:hypothetical protein
MISLGAHFSVARLIVQIGAGLLTVGGIVGIVIFFYYLHSIKKAVDRLNDNFDVIIGERRWSAEQRLRESIEKKRQD